ncbi:hypothetical protein M2324_003494 [Rhodovulum sulfidophilum]|nr:hypothetical protein [Rhodovulum sulfidophilum]
MAVVPGTGTGTKGQAPGSGAVRRTKAPCG